MSKRVLRIAVPVVLGACVLTACGSHGSRSGTTPAPHVLTAEDFTTVCDGKPISAAKPFDAAARTGHKTLFLETNPRNGQLYNASSTLPDDWTVSFNPGDNALGGVDVVICAKRTQVKLAKECSGYTIDNKASDLVVKMHTATYHVTTVEALTGKQLAASDLEATDGSCPTSLVAVGRNTTSMDDYATLKKDQVIAFAKPFVRP